jgi:hypothetical protein
MVSQTIVARTDQEAACADDCDRGCDSSVADMGGPRECYELKATATARWSIKQANARKCMPSSVVGSRS